MAVIKAFFGLVFIFVFVVFGYWMYATYTLRTADNAVWDGINVVMPRVLQHWSCAQVRQRAGADPAPKSCAAFWDVPGPEAEAAPGLESDADEAGPAAAPQASETAPARPPGDDR